MGRKGHHLGTVQEVNVLRNFKIQKYQLISPSRPDRVLFSKKKKELIISWILAIPADNSVKMKESEQNEKYLTLDKELAKLLDMKVTVIPIVEGALGTVNKDLEKRIKVIY